MANSKDRENNSISTDSDHFFVPVWDEFKRILQLLNLPVENYVFVKLTVESIRKYDSMNNSVAVLDVMHTPEVDRCSHADITIHPEKSSMLSNHLFKKLKQSLSKMVIEIISSNDTTRGDHRDN